MSGDEGSALEARLRCQPDDWDSWLVYADLLMERGDPRGQLVVLEHRITQGGPGADALLAERDALVARLQPGWAIDALPQGAVIERRFGLIVGAVVPAVVAPARLGALLAHPEARLLSRLQLRPPDDPDALGWEEAPDEPSDDTPRPEPIDGAGIQLHLSEPIELEEGGVLPPTCLPEAWIRQLAALDLSRIRHLSLAYCPLGVGVRHLVASPQLGGLAGLDLRYAYLGDPGAEALAAGRHLRGLRRLHLQRNQIGPIGAVALAGAAHLAGLALLDLRDNPLGAAGAAALADSPYLAELTSLRIFHGDIGDEGAGILAGSGSLALHIRRYWRGRARA